MGLTGEEADVVDNEVQPEWVSQGRALWKLGKVAPNAR